MFRSSRIFSSMALALPLLLVSELQAQEPIDIGLFQEGQMLEVRVRPNADFDGIFSAVVFTVRWDGSTGATLGDIVQEGAAATYIPTKVSGGVHELGNMKYQVYAGFGFETISNTGLTWKEGKEYVIARIPFTGSAEFGLVNDSWTAQPESNANYYLSLGGTDRTGVIYKSLVNASGEGAISIQPNPNNGQFTILIPVDGKSDVNVELVNSVGQTVFQEVVRNNVTELYKHELDVRNYGSGAYHLRVMRNGQMETHKVVVQ